MLGPCRSRIADAGTFAACAALYWLQVFPRARREIRRWQELALGIPDERLRALALATQQGERGNLEGAAAFALIAAPDSRAAIVRAAIAFQTAYDYVDTLAEETGADPRTNALRLHLVLLAALDERRRHPGLEDCRHAARGEDGGYLAAILEGCREALRELPSYPVVRGACLRAATRMAVYQSLIHVPEPECELRAWAVRLGEHRPDGTARLYWWETAAGAASSLVVFALFAAAAEPALGPDGAEAIELAYFPAVGALHVLLDSFADLEADARSGHHSLVSHYPSPSSAGERLAVLAAEARAKLAPLAQGPRHEAVLAAMAGFYLSSSGARSRNGRARAAIGAASGPLASPATAVLRARRVLSAARARLSAGRLRGHVRRRPRGHLRGCVRGRLRGWSDRRASFGLLESQVVDFPLAALRMPQR